jgi:hypothetical protein
MSTPMSSFIWMRFEVRFRRAEGAEANQPRASESASAALGLDKETRRALKGRG